MAKVYRRLTWYGVRCVFKLADRPLYEERITVWLADSMDAAIQKSEAEASDYAETVGLEYVGLAQAYDLRTRSLANGSEVFSLMRDSDLAPDDYLDHFFDTGAERQQSTPREP